MTEDGARGSEKAPPKFRYQPNCYENGVFRKARDGEESACRRCGEHAQYYCDRMYAEEDPGRVCPECVASGAAARKFGGVFVKDAQGISGGSDRRDELFRRAPGYRSFEGEAWLAHCDDYCAFIGHVGVKELARMGIADEVFGDYEKTEGAWEGVREYLAKDGSPAGYLFRCLHCGKYRLQADLDL